MPELELISADDHLQETADLWEKRLPRRLRDHDGAPRVIKMPDGSSVWRMGDRMLPAKSAVVGAPSTAKADKHWLEGYKENGPQGSGEPRPGTYDPDERLKDMDIDGVYASVLFPNVAITFDGMDEDLRRECAKAYNDHLVDFCSTDPSRLIGIANLPWGNDVEDIITEVKRVGTNDSVRGALLPVFPANDKLWNDPMYEPVWQTLDELGLVMCAHIGVPRGLHTFGSRSKSEGGKPFGGHAGGGEAFLTLVTLSVTETIASILWGGVFDRYPSLKLVAVESGIGWLAYFSERADHVYERNSKLLSTGLQNPPSYYFGRNIAATFEEDYAGIQTRDLAGVEAFMWGSDYPHADTSWPRSRETLAENLKELSEGERRKIVYENAARIFNIR